MAVFFGDFSEYKRRRKELLIVKVGAGSGAEVAIVLVSAVVAVAENRMPEMCELGPDLVCAPGYKLGLDFGYIFAVRSRASDHLQDAVSCRDGEVAVLMYVVDEDIASSGFFEITFDLFHDRVVGADARLARCRNAADKTAVTFDDVVCLKERDCVLQIVFALCQKDKAARIHVDPVAEINRRIFLVAANTVDQGHSR